MGDALTAEIDRLQGERDAAMSRVLEGQREVELMDMQLKALRLAADLRPYREPRVRMEVRSKGRQVGAISRTWRRILVEARDKFPEGATPDEVAAVAKNNGINIRDRDANARCKRYEGQGIMEATSYGWLLRSSLVERFRVEGNLPPNPDQNETDNEEGGDMAA